MKRILPFFFFLLAVIALSIYFIFKLPPDVESKGNPIDLWIQIVSLLTAVLSLIAGVVTLITTVRQGKSTKNVKHG